ncbi:MAG TPA: outer membrane lipoprotein carrier protein LolA [Gemmatimonadaceae bacterium]
MRASCRVLALAWLVGVAPWAQAQARAQGAGDSLSAMALYQKAAARFASARTMRAGFEQTLISAITKIPRVSRGEMLQRPPARFAFRFTDPAGDAVVADGEALWIYLPSAAKGQVLKLPREAGGAFDVVARLLANPGDKNQVRIVPESDMVGGEAVRLYALTPRSDGAPFQSAKVWIGEDALVRQIEIEEPGGLRRRLRFSNMRLGVSLPRNAFEFTVPDGVRVVDQAALLGGGVRKP